MTTNKQCCLGIYQTNKQTPVQLIPYLSSPTKTTPWHLERVLHKHLSHLTIDDEEEEEVASYNPVKLYLSEDAHLLKCRRRFPSENKQNVNSMFGIWENTSLLLPKPQFESLSHSQEEEEEEEDVNISLQLYKPSTEMIQMQKCHCIHPKGNWTRCNLTVPTTKTTNHPKGHASTKQPRANVTIVDLTSIQQRRIQQVLQNDETSTSLLTWNTPGRVCHLLRSILICDHDDGNTNATSSQQQYQHHASSPWSHAYNTNHETTGAITEEEGRVDNVIAILVYLGITNNDDDDDNDDEDSKCLKLEREEYNELVKFRTGDACPSYYLYSCSHVDLEVPSSQDATNDDDGAAACDALFHDLASYYPHDPSLNARNSHDHDDGMAKTKKGALLIYRQIPPRDRLSPYPPQPSSSELDKIPQDESSNHDIIDNGTRNVASDGCLWETYTDDTTIEDDANPKDNDHDINNAEEEIIVQHRKVAPPYISIEEEYPNLMNHFLNPENLQAIREEALRIPQWTAWPERQHYHSTSSDDEDDDDEKDSKQQQEESAPPAPASWTVFPLCHTFPATDLTSRKFISSTCSFVPKTTQLLHTLGPTLRTALFSRLDPQTVLSAHTGWADLANYVLRVHIPLVVPKDGSGESENDDADTTKRGLCGTWVDGCVETHEEGHLICFDDSKTHRAFNYSKEERIVLIVDLERDIDGKEGVRSCLPIGTATGGHTEELDAFIDQLT